MPRYAFASVPLAAAVMLGSAHAAAASPYDSEPASNQGDASPNGANDSRCTPGCSRSCPKHRCLLVPWAEASITSFGIRPSGMAVSVGSAGDSTFGATLSSFMSETRTRDYFTVHSYGQGLLGGGTGGLEGGLDGALGFGLRAPLGDDHGPLIRAGASGLLLGNDLFYASYIEVPTAWLGYQYMSDDGFLIEGGARGGALLSGRFFPGPGKDARRNIDGLDYGAYLLLSVPSARLVFNGEWLRADVKNDPGGPFDMVRGSACAHVSPLVICADGRYVTSRVNLVTPPVVGTATAQAFYGGVTIGIGSFKSTGFFASEPVGGEKR